MGEELDDDAADGEDVDEDDDDAAENDTDDDFAELDDIEGGSPSALVAPSSRLLISSTRLVCCLWKSSRRTRRRPWPT
jgi:hypothetical protein